MNPHNCLKSLTNTGSKPLKECEKCGKLWELYHGEYIAYYSSEHDIELWNYGTENEMNSL